MLLDRLCFDVLRVDGLRVEARLLDLALLDTLRVDGLLLVELRPLLLF